jgi:hypothetical protein
MAALSNKDYKQGWLSGYYPYSEYTIVDNNLVLGGDIIKVNNEILTKDIIKESNSGFDNSSITEQTGGRDKVKKYKIKSDSVENAFRKLEGKVRGEGDILILHLKSLDDKKKINFYKIYRKKI